MFSMGSHLCKMFKKNELNHGSILRKFLLVCRGLPTMSPDVVWKMLYFGGETPFPRCIPSDPWYPNRKRKRGHIGGGETGASLERETSKKSRFSRSKRR